MKPHGDRENDGKRALIIGLGVVGLPLAQRLAQAGWQLVLCDIDRVEWKNLTKQFWDAEHVGELKTRAAAAIIRRHAPDARIALVEGDLRHLGVGFFQQVDLVAACVDNRAAERHAARLAAFAGKDFVRLATRGEARVSDVTFVPGPRSPRDPCGLCTWSADDYALADLRESCFAEVEVNPDAGALTFAEHGTVAAAITADALLRGEIGPPRLVRFTGGPSPVTDTTAIPFSPGCRLGGDVRGVHGPIDHEVLLRSPSDLTVGEVVQDACEQLGSPIDRVLVELDSPVCRLRQCGQCGQTSAGFRAYSGVACERCGGLIRQELEPAVSRCEAARLRELASSTFTHLGAPVGLGLRFSVREGARRTWDVCLPADVEEFLLNGSSEGQHG